jgi:hypothetical protein
VDLENLDLGLDFIWLLDLAYQPDPPFADHFWDEKAS